MLLNLVPNWCVALSNVYGIYLAIANRKEMLRVDFILMTSCAIASFLMHLSDVKVNPYSMQGFKSKSSITNPECIHSIGWPENSSTWTGSLRVQRF